MRQLIASALLTALAAPALADDTALLIGIERYEQLQRLPRAANIQRAQEGLQALGFEVLVRANARADVAADLAASFAQTVSDADRLIVVLTGRFVTDGRRTWLLTAEAEAPSLFTLPGQALSVDSLLDILGRRPGNALMVLGLPERDRTEPADDLVRMGVGDLVIPQGVTVLQGDVTEIVPLVRNQLTVPESDLADLFDDEDIQAKGYLPSSYVFMPGAIEVEEVPLDPGPTEDQLTAEARAWDRATAEDTVAAYRAYIRAFPDGRFVEVAEETIAAIIAEPNRSARLAEEALNLNRSARRQVQADLDLLGFDPRGIDGIFGQGSRRAITNWQQSNGYPQTSYLTQEQINRLSAQAERRRAEIAAAEAAAQAERERLDREFWSETGAAGDEAGYRAYLRRYPEGLFADVANRRLEAIEADRRAEAEAEDRVAWGEAAAANTVRAYQNYLAAYPDGVFAEEARNRIEALSAPDGPTEAQIAQARNQERALGLTGVRAQLLELRLREFGFNPGRIDGVVDNNTRRALAAYQQSVGIPATGYLDQGSLVGLMAGARGR